MSLYKSKSKIHGSGIYTNQKINSGVNFYVIRGKSLNFPKQNLARIGDSWIDDPILNQINHSCISNSNILKGQDEIYLRSIRNIKIGEEITVDYNTTEMGSKKIKCLCNSETCKKYFTIFDYRDFFKNKKITIMGLGLLGGALNDAIFLAKCGVKLTITDLKTKKELEFSLKKLKKYSRIKYVLGQHDIEDFKKADLILQPGNVPTNSLYLIEARKNNIPIHESESLFMQYANGITTIGITGTRGKTTTTYLIYEIIKSWLETEKSSRNVFLAGNVKGNSTLALLGKIRGGDIVVMEMDSWCLNGLSNIKKSPNISVFTNFMPDHLNFYFKGSCTEKEALERYFNDKSQIYFNQKKNDYLICGENISRKIGNILATKIITKKSDVPKDWKTKIKGDHNLENIACAIAVARVLRVDEKIIKKAVENFNGVEGRLQFVRGYKGVRIYNDTTSTTPDATIVALKSLGNIKKNNVVLIMGGADKNLDMTELVKEIPKYCRSLVLLSGTGTNKVESLKSKVKSYETDNLKEAVLMAINDCQKGDILLFSPAFASFGMFKNEFDRGDKFINIINSL